MAISEFWYFRFWPRKLKILVFRKIKAYKPPIFWSYLKTVQYVVNLHTNKSQTKFQSNIFIFGCTMVKNPGKGDGVTFLNAIFGISNCRTQKIIFLRSLDKTGQDRHVYGRKFWFGKFDLFDLFWAFTDLSSGQT